jgi:hypothetical protein
LEEERGGKGRSTEEREGRKEWGLAELATQCLGCCRNTTVVTNVVKSQKLVFENFFKFYCYYICNVPIVHVPENYHVHLLSGAISDTPGYFRTMRKTHVLTKVLFHKITVQNDTLGKVSMYC